jgi:hypothetical protein
MATSGSVDFTVTRDEIIQEALEVMGVLGEGETPNTNQLTSLSRTLNMMIKNWQADGLNLFAVRRQFLFLEKGILEYDLGATTTRHFTENFTQYATDGVTAQGTNTVTLTDATGVADTNFIGLASGTDVFWTTVNGAPVGNVVTLTDNLTFSIPDNAIVYVYAVKANRPMKIVNGYIRIGGNLNSNDIPLDHLSREEYITLSQKESVGVTTQFYYDPQIGSGQFFPWPTINDETSFLTLYVQRTLEDLDAASDNFDYPQEWFMPLAWNLAMHSALKYSIPSNEYYIIERQAVELYERAKEFDEELYTSLRFSPENLRNQG